MTWARKAGERLRAMRSDEGAVDAVIALVRWMRAEKVERPWRLTRRQRVEMEAALAGFRARIVASPRRVDRLRDSEDIEDAPLTPGWGQTVPVEPGRMFPTERATRVARVRVAIALRAALRADEDARCEEAEEAAMRDYGVADQMQIDTMREWPSIDRSFDHRPGHWSTFQVPLALWERAPLLSEPPASVGD